jgi:hypothetical protein
MEYARRYGVIEALQEGKLQPSWPFLAKIMLLVAYNIKG